MHSEPEDFTPPDLTAGTSPPARKYSLGHATHRGTEF